MNSSSTYSAFILFIIIWSIRTTVYGFHEGNENKDFAYSAVDPEELFKAFEEDVLSEDKYKKHGIVRRMEQVGVTHEDSEPVATAEPDTTTAGSHSELTTEKDSKRKKEDTTTTELKNSTSSKMTTTKKPAIISPKKKYNLDICICDFHVKMLFILIQIMIFKYSVRV